MDFLNEKLIGDLKDLNKRREALQSKLHETDIKQFNELL